MLTASAGSTGTPLAWADVPPDPAIAPDEIRQVVDEVLARPEYARAEPGLLQRAFDRVLEALAQAFDAAAATGAGRVAGVLVLLALVALLAWLVARALSRTSWDRRQAVTVAGPAGRSADEWLSDAAAHERAGDLRQALRCHYRALLADLAARGVVDEVPGTTTGEYRQAVAEALPEGSDAFAEVTEAFERAWYGRRPVTRPDLEAAVAAARRVRDRATRPVEAAR